MSVTSDFAEFVNKMTYDNIPPDVIKKAKKLILDLFGSILCSSKMDWSKKVVALVKDYKSQGNSTVIPFGFNAAAPAAALANGTMGHGFELDDVHKGGMHHPGAVVIPAALAVGEQELVDGRQFLLAVIMGYEAMCRIGMAVGAKHHNLKGFHATGTSGPFGAAVASGKIIGLNKDGFIDALGIAGSFCSGSMEFSREQSEAGGMIKRLHAGRASESGLIAALLAKDGFRGPSDIIGGRYGFCNVYSDHPQIHLMNLELGLHYEILNVGIKPYPCCAMLHSIIDAITYLKNEYGLKAEEVEEIKIGCSENQVNHSSIYEIGSIMAAQYSAPFSVALALTGDVTDPKNFTKEYAGGIAVKEIIKKTRLYKDHDLDRIFPRIMGAKVNVRLKDGKLLQNQVMYAKGTPENEISFEEVCNKFYNLSEGIIDNNRKNQIIETINNLEGVSNMSELTKLLVNN